MSWYNKDGCPILSNKYNRPCGEPANGRDVCGYHDALIYVTEIAFKMIWTIGKA